MCNDLNLYTYQKLQKYKSPWYCMCCFRKELPLKIKPNIIGISETRLQRGKQPITNISLLNYVYEHTPTESGKGGTLIY